MNRNTVETSYGKVSFLLRKGKKYLVLLHGLGGVGNNFMKISSCLDDDIGLVFPDLLGHGRSAKPDDIRISDQARMINELMRLLNLKDFFVGGNSYGGWVALSYETTFKNSLGLVLMDSAGTNLTVGDQGQETVEKFLERLERVSPKNDMRIMRKIVENNSGKTYKISEDQLEKITKRTLIIWGMNDHMIPSEYGVRMSQLIPDSTLKLIQSGTHTPHISSSDEVCRSIEDFLNRE